MKHHFECPTVSGNSGFHTLVFDWDDETGEVSGPDADYILKAFRYGYVHLHPIPSGGRKLTSTKDIVDLAAVVGDVHVLPPGLEEHYPDPELDDFDGYVRDVVGQVCF
ncbi:MAG: hypothetical protein LBI87_14075 [Candidatus Accumulibacter sp.]|jgi:hypothetical protein|nr:hypothetical protein [Accumulibacter sp.]